MSTISNKFFIQVLDDGSNMHGQLLATITPTQAYRNGTFVPDWETTASARPLIYLDLLNGATPITPDAGYTWSYNGTVITFSSTQTTVTIGSSTYFGFVSTGDTAGKFFMTGTHSSSTEPLEGQPALGIVGNLASSSNVDLDTITFTGTKNFGGDPVSFSATMNVTITQFSSGGYVGVISYPNGNIITQPNQNITCTAVLYNESSSVTDATYKWYREGIDTTTPWKTGSSITINESDVTDYMVIRCDFERNISGTENLQVVYSAFGSVDDQQDPEFMWISYGEDAQHTANGNAASLRKGETVTYSVLVGTADSKTPIGGTANPTYNSFKLKVLDAENEVVMDETQGTSIFGTGSHIGAADANGFRVLDAVSQGAATFTIAADIIINYCKKGITGVLYAESVSNNS